MSLPDDPDARSLLYVQQYLAELGYTEGDDWVVFTQPILGSCEHPLLSVLQL
jgi:hypothetical protein